jgi:hypothetical protein
VIVKARCRFGFRATDERDVADLDPLMVPCLKRQTLHFEPAVPTLQNAGAGGG